MTEGGVTAGILESAVTPASVALGKKRLEVGGGEAHRPHGWCSANDAIGVRTPIGISAHINRGRRSRMTRSPPSKSSGPIAEPIATLWILICWPRLRRAIMLRADRYRVVSLTGECAVHVRPLGRNALVGPRDDEQFAICLVSCSRRWRQIALDCRRLR